MNELALFAGAGGGILASHLLGWTTICAVERDAYAAQILAQRQNDGILKPFPIWSDIESFDGSPWRGRVDVISGGFPCQAFSTAARGRNITSKDMWHEMLRIAAEVQPSYVHAENVSQQAIDKAADELEALGYQVKCIELSAADLGADHIRSRFWLCAYTDNQSELCSAIHAEMASLPKLFCSIWQTKPYESGASDGLAYRVDRFKAIGNGQVPAVAATAFRLLMEQTA